MIKKYLKDKLLEWIGLLFLALVMIAVTLVVKLVLGWFRYDHATREAMSKSIGETVGMVLFGLVILLGIYVRVQEFLAKRSAAAMPSMPPPLSARVAQTGLSVSPPPVPTSNTDNGTSRGLSLEKQPP